MLDRWKVEYWLKENETSNVQYSEYWNDEEEEINKIWYVLDNNFDKMESYLGEIGLLKDLITSTQLLKKKFNYELQGAGIDLACGNCWAAPHILKNIRVNKLYCLEYSKHRLLKVGPKLLEHYSVSTDKIRLVLGSFYSMKLDDHSLDFAFMAQAFHHAGQPELLLNELARVLKPGGIVIIIGEHILNLKKLYFKHIFRILISRLIPLGIQRKFINRTFENEGFCRNVYELLPPDEISGDHYYTLKDYYYMFSKYGFDVEHFKSQYSPFQSFVLQVPLPNK